MTPELTENNISQFSSEDLYAAINNLFPHDDAQIANNCLKRFYELIQEDIGTESSSIDEEGRITVDMRILEPHLFSKIMGALALNPDLFYQCELVHDLGNYAMVYIKKHSLNFSFDDKCLSLVSILNFSNPSPGKILQY